MSPERDERRLRRALAALADREPAGSDCPTADALWSAARGEATATDVRAVVDHTTRCPACAEAWRLAVRLDPPGAVRPEASRGGAGRRAWLGVAAALVIAAVALPFALRERTPSPEPGFRGKVGPIETLVPESDSLPRDACVLRWSEPAAGARYRVEVASGSLENLAGAEELESNRFHVPPEAIAELPPGSKIYWRVRAELPDGRVVTGPTFIHSIE